VNTKKRHSSSFRDPSGYVFTDEGIIKRSISPIYFSQYKALKAKNIFERLFNANLLIPHTEISVSDTQIVIQPEHIPFITFPYEWSFNQYKEAALVTLKLQKFCLENDFSLKDASAFNVAFHKGKAVFIDTLSFDFYTENSPWRAYKQFVMHFLGPLVLAKYNGAEALKLMTTFIDGIPLKQLSAMLPFKTKLNPFLYSNIHLLAKFEDRHKEDYTGKAKQPKLSKDAQLKIVEALYDYIKNLSINEASEWGNYYAKTNYTDTAFETKATLINKWVTNLNPKTIIDIGGNDGTFVRRIAHKFDLALVCDIDNNAVDCNYQQLKTDKEIHMLPLVLDVLNPSASIGFNNNERSSFLNRIMSFAPDVTMALAVIHHLTLSGNVPFEMSVQFFASFSKHLIIEFPKRDDSWVQRLLNTKGEFKSHFDFYTIENFEIAFCKEFKICDKIVLKDSKRVMYFLEKNAE
jgi:hypothetical protein